MAQWWDHPRLRGEHLLILQLKFLLLGSPPPTRGTLLDHLMYGVKTRITPAYAGNTQASRWGNNDLEDHPRLRGEHVLY